MMGKGSRSKSYESSSRMAAKKRKRRRKICIWAVVLFLLILGALWLIDRDLSGAGEGTGSDAVQNESAADPADTTQSGSAADPADAAQSESAADPADTVQSEAEADLNSLSLTESDPGSIPYAHTDSDYITLNNNLPSFTEYDLSHMQGEYYSSLDSLGRCGTACACLNRSMTPTGERKRVVDIRPSGWRQEKYPGVINSDPAYLYHRCHLIAYAMTGQNENEKNLITGTEYMNEKGMYPFEGEVIYYLACHPKNHVLYRVTPYFHDDELVARGVEMEARSVEDDGKGICFHVFVYNYQPGITIDYRTGKSERTD